MQRLEVSGAVRPIYGSLGVKRLNRFYASFIQLSLPLIPSHTQQILSDTVRPKAVILNMFFTLKFAE